MNKVGTKIGAINQESHDITAPETSPMSIQQSLRNLLLPMAKTQDRRSGWCVRRCVCCWMSGGSSRLGMLAYLRFCSIIRLDIQLRLRYSCERKDEKMNVESTISAFVVWCHYATMDDMMKLYQTDSKPFAIEKLHRMQERPHLWWSSLDSHNRQRLVAILEARVAASESPSLA